MFVFSLLDGEEEEMERLVDEEIEEGVEEEKHG